GFVEFLPQDRLALSFYFYLFSRRGMFNINTTKDMSIFFPQQFREKIQSHQRSHCIRQTLVCAFLVLPYPPSPSLPLIPVPLINSTDELFKSSAYLTEAYYLSGAEYLTLTTQTPFNFAFGMEKGILGGWREGG